MDTLPNHLKAFHMFFYNGLIMLWYLKILLWPCKRFWSILSSANAASKKSFFFWSPLFLGCWGYGSLTAEAEKLQIPREPRLPPDVTWFTGPSWLAKISWKGTPRSVQWWIRTENKEPDQSRMETQMQEGRKSTGRWTVQEGIRLALRPRDRQIPMKMRDDPDRILGIS